jgi:hypothetical protein
MTAEGVSAAEAIAASLCWLARFRWGELGATYSGVLEGTTYWHKANCRFCTKPTEDLITTYGLDRVEATQLKAFKELSRSTRAARIREAQEVPWYEQL